MMAYDLFSRMSTIFDIQRLMGVMIALGLCKREEDYVGGFEYCGPGDFYGTYSSGLRRLIQLPSSPTRYGGSLLGGRVWTYGF